MIFAWVVLLVTGFFMLRVVGRVAAAVGAGGSILRAETVHNFIWAISLAMAWLATGTYIIAVDAQSPVAFRLYYLLGAMLMAAYMGLGSLWLWWGRTRAQLARAATWGVVILSLVGAVGLFLAPMDEDRLAGLAGQPGTGVIASDGAAGLVWLLATIVLNTFGVAALVLVAAASALRARRQAGGASGVNGAVLAGPRVLPVGNALIALGGILEGLAGSAARVGFPGAFWVTLAAGWILIYAGFEFLTRTPRTSLGRRESY